MPPPEPVALVRETEETGNGDGGRGRGKEEGGEGGERYPATEDETRTTTRVEKQMWGNKPGDPCARVIDAPAIFSFSSLQERRAAWFSSRTRLGDRERERGV